MEIEKKHNTASVYKDHRCKECGWPIINACCDDGFQNFKDAIEWDWWLYCSNKACKNHDGEGLGKYQELPLWAEETVNGNRS